MSSWIPNFSQTALLIWSPLLLLLPSSKICSTVCKSTEPSWPPFPTCLQFNHYFFHCWCLQPFWTPFSLHKNSDFARPSQVVSLHLCPILKSFTTIQSSYLPKYSTTLLPELWERGTSSLLVPSQGSSLSTYNMFIIVQMPTCITTL